MGYIYIYIYIQESCNLQLMDNLSLFSVAIDLGGKLKVGHNCDTATVKKHQQQQ